MWAFTVKNVNVDYLKDMVSKYKDKDISVELVTHAGYVDDYTRNITSYLGRDKELEVLKEAKEQGIFDNIKLISFSEL